MGAPAGAQQSSEAAWTPPAQKVKKKSRPAPLASWPSIGQVGLSLVVAVIGLIIFTYLQNQAMSPFDWFADDPSLYFDSVFFVQLGLYYGLGLVFVLIRWLTADSRSYLWSTFLAVVWLSIYFLRIDNRPWMLGILVLLAGVVFPIALLFMGIVVDFVGEKLRPSGAFALSLLIPLVVFVLFALSYYMSSGQSSGGHNLSAVPWTAPWYWGDEDEMSFLQRLGMIPVGQFLAFVIVILTYIPIATRRIATQRSGSHD